MADDTKRPTDSTDTSPQPGATPEAGESGSSASASSTDPESSSAPDGLAAGRDEDAAAREQAKREAIADAEKEAGRLAGHSGEAQASSKAGAGAEASSQEDLESQVADLTDRLLRAHAEIQNLHKRLERDIVESQKYGITKFARDVVAMTDNFERALSSVSADAAKDNAALAGLLDGVRMIEKEFQGVLGKHDVKRLDPTNEPFDPHKHQAVMERDDASVPSGTVVQVFQAGYEIGDRVLRPAMVVVAKGGPKAPKPVATESEPETSTDAAKPAEDAAKPETEPQKNNGSDETSGGAAA